MKILCVSQRFFPSVGGAEHVLEMLMDYLSQRHEITVCTTNALGLNSFWDDKAKTIDQTYQGKNYQIKRYEIVTPSQISSEMYEFPFSIGIPGPFSPDMWNYVLTQSNNYDLIVASAFPYDHIIPAYIASKKFNIPLIFIPHIHLEFPEIYLTGFRLGMLSDSNMIVVNTQEEKNELLKYEISEKKIRIIPPSIDISSWSNIPTKDMRVDLALSPDSIIVLFAGTKSHEKGIINLIEALKKLWARKINVELVMIGPSNEEFNAYIKRQKNEIRKHMHDLGVVNESEKKSIFDSCDIFALPSKSESFGISYLEAWMCKKPVIACDIKAVRELIDNDVNGLLTDLGDVDNLTAALEKLIKNPKLRNQLGDNGYKKALSRYDSRIYLSEFEKICTSLN